MSMDPTFIKKLSRHARQSLFGAQEIALRSGESSIEPKHLLLSLLAEKGGLGGLILENAGFRKDRLGALRPTKSSTKPKSKESFRTIDFSSATKNILIRSFSIASEHHSPYVGTEHFALALAESGDSSVGNFFSAFGVERDKTATSIRSHLNLEHFPPLSKMFNLPEITLAKKSAHTKESTPFLDQYAIDLGARTEDEPFVGRAAETERILHILGRKHKNNPLLLGEPGVGKTALVAALARHIREDRFSPLAGKKILSLDLALIVAGTSFRGEFEARMKEIVREATNNPSVILFIDEIHTLVGAGNSTGGLDAANILKPALARGDIRLIGATTLVEYKRHIEKDPALDRRFQTILVHEPSAEEAEQILLESKSSFEEFHDVSIDDTAIKTAVELSVRYIHDRFLPDKAFDLLDEASSLAKQSSFSSETHSTKLARLEADRRTLQKEKEEAILAEDYDRAAIIKAQELHIQKTLSSLPKISDTSKTRKKRGVVAPEHIVRILSKTTGIPIEKLSPENRQPFSGTAKNALYASIRGQKQAIDIVTKSLVRSAAGTSDPKRPLASFLFLGPSGVGKTLLAKTIAEHFFGNEHHLVRIDMSEFGERHNIAQLIGSPAGYVGYGEGGKLTEKIRRAPYSVVLFDEIEKAHPDTTNILLSILEDGILTDAEGRSANFRNTIIILTSNIGTHSFTTEKIGFDRARKTESIRNDILDELKKTLRPELLSRLGDVVLFDPLDEQSLAEIATLELEKLAARLKKNRYSLRWTKTVPARIGKESAEMRDGGRLVRKKIESDIEHQVAEIILTKPKAKKILLSEKNGTIVATTP